MRRRPAHLRHQLSPSASVHPPVTREVREIHSSLTRLESRLERQRAEFKQIRVLDSRANTDTILGSTLVGLGLFLVSGAPLPGSLSAQVTIIVQLVGVGLGFLGLTVLVQAYREWRAIQTRRGTHRRRHGVLGKALVLLALGAGGFATLQLMSTLR
ncbi:MAG: hypothetical protein EXR48_03365 [Dehalococcoidia bacterium]|nr:hypothetical protein [Dehalococcoidia bacterium]